MCFTVFDGAVVGRTVLEGAALRSAAPRSSPSDGTLRDRQPAEAMIPEGWDEPDAAGPEEDGLLEIDFIHGRLSMDLELHGDGDGPELDGLDIARLEVTRFPQELDCTQGDEMGPELDLEQVLADDEPR